jgi:hypothetical protein
MKTKSLLTVLCFSALILFGFQVLSPPSTAFALEATVDIEPNTINLNRGGKWITVHIAVPSYNVSDIDRTNINMTDDPLNPTWNVPSEWSNIEGNVLMVKFDSSEVISHLWSLLDGHMGRHPRTSIELTIVGFVKGTPFAGSDTVTIMDPIGKE